jgi:hypothetical protein
LGAEGGWSGATQLKGVATFRACYSRQLRSQCKELLLEVFTYKALKRFLAISEKLEGLCYELKDLYKLNGVLLGLKVALTVINNAERCRV